MKPDFSLTPVSTQRADYGYRPGSHSDPLVSIITPYFNAGPVFWETARSLLRMSFVDWEWIVVNDGTTDAESQSQLERLPKLDARVRLVKQDNLGPSAARNRAVKESSGRYIFQIDADDLVEPTFLEKAIWLLETQPQFSFVNSWTVNFGQTESLWREGFSRLADFLTRNWVHMCALIRREAWRDIGGYDESLRKGNEDWEFWLRMAQRGHWGYTIQEYLTWFRWQGQEHSLRHQMSMEEEKQFISTLQERFGEMGQKFPNPLWKPEVEYAEIEMTLPFRNRVERKQSETRVLMLLPWLEQSGADRFNLEAMRALSARNYKFTIVTTAPAQNDWYNEFLTVTPDIFSLDAFLNRIDYPRFLSYLIESRGINAIVISNSENGYLMLPYLQSRHPEVALLDFNHMEQPGWRSGGYPSMAARVRPPIDVNIVASEHLKSWMQRNGADASRLKLVRAGVDPDLWTPAAYERPVVRESLGIRDETPIILFVGRVVARKRPLLFANVIKRLNEANLNFAAFVIGDGEELPMLQSNLKEMGLAEKVRCLGSQSNERVREIMAGADILLLPSQHEGIAAVLYEAMAMEVIPVAADVGGARELVTTETGYLIPRQDDKAAELGGYVETLKGLLTDPLRRQIVQKRARKRITDLFSMKQTAEQLDQAIREAQTAAIQRTTPVIDQALARWMTHLNVELMRRERTIDRKFATHEIQETKAWKATYSLVTRWWDLKLKLLPLGSRRLKWYEQVTGRLTGSKAEATTAAKGSDSGDVN
ncbi:MAG: glycosyltransferase [Anaerolineae bacterium]